MASWTTRTRSRGMLSAAHRVAVRSAGSGRTVSAAYHQQPLDGQREGDRSQPAHRQRQGDGRQPEQDQVPVVAQPALEQVARRAGRVEQGPAGVQPGQLPLRRAQHAVVARALEQLALVDGEDRVQPHQQHPAARGYRDHLRAVAAVQVLRHGPRERGQGHQRGLLGERGRREGQRGGGTGPDGPPGRVREDERQEQPRRDEIVEEGPPGVDERERAEPEQQRGRGRTRPAEAEPAPERVDQGRADHLRDQHALVAEGDGRVVPVEAVGEHRPQRDLDPTGRCVVVEVRVRRERVLVLQRPGLGQVRPGVVDVVGEGGRPDRVDRADRDQCQQEHGDAGPVPLQPFPGRDDELAAQS